MRAAYVAGRRPCELYATEPFLGRMTYALAVRRGAARLRAALDRELRRARTAGHLQAMYLRWWRDECAANDDDDNDGYNSHVDDDNAYIPATTTSQTAIRLARYNDARRTAPRPLCHLTAAFLTLVGHFMFH